MVRKPATRPMTKVTLLPATMISGKMGNVCVNEIEYSSQKHHSESQTQISLCMKDSPWTTGPEFPDCLDLTLPYTF